MAFHRLVTPVYLGGLPGGYDYLNNAVSGTPAPFDGARLVGPNAGTYLLGFGEDARSQSVNRGLKALGDNTDALDDLFHRDIVNPAVTATVTAGGGGVTSIILTGPDIFVGNPGHPNTVAGISQLFQLLDDEENVIFNAGSPCQITSITGGPIGSSWSAANVTLNISPAIPAGVNYQVFYNTRTNLSAITTDWVFKNRPRYRRYNGGPTWADGTTNPATFITSQLDKIITDLATSNGDYKVAAVTKTAISWFTTPAFALSGPQVGAQLQELLQYVNEPYRFQNITSNLVLDGGGFRDTGVVVAAVNLQITLMAASAHPGREFHINDRDGLVTIANPLTLVRTGADLIDNVGANRLLYATYGRWRVWSNGTQWFTSSG